MHIYPSLRIGRITTDKVTRYVKGAGGIHLRQYARGHPDSSFVNYHLDVRIFDSSVDAAGKKRTPNLIGQAYGLELVPNVAVAVTSNLPYVLLITSPKFGTKDAGDSDPLHVQYAGQDFLTSDTKHCSMGIKGEKHHGWESGARNGDCGLAI